MNRCPLFGGRNRVVDDRLWANFEVPKLAERTAAISTLPIKHYQSGTGQYEPLHDFISSLSGALLATLTRVQEPFETPHRYQRDCTYLDRLDFARLDQLVEFRASDTC